MIVGKDGFFCVGVWMICWGCFVWLYRVNVIKVYVWKVWLDRGNRVVGVVRFGGVFYWVC